jgi:hypothetical protein
MKNFQASSALKPLLPALVVFAFLTLGPQASSQEQVLFSFGAVDGTAAPNGGVANDPKGNLYFASNGNCTGTCSVIFELSPPTTPNGQWLAQSAGDLGFLNAGVVWQPGGNIYGTASGGSSAFGYVFQIVAPEGFGCCWSINTIYNFKGGTDASAPTSTLILDSEGNLYGASYNGQVFEVKPPAKRGGAWTESVLYNVGNSPTGVILDQHGNLFGTALLGGSNGNGFVFELSPPTSGSAWTEQIIYNFAASTAKSIRRPLAQHGSALPPKGLDLGLENGIAMDANGNIFGTQTYGGTTGVGYVYELTPPSSGGAWSFSNLYSFTGAATGSTDGAYPGAGVTIGRDGSLYGTTYLGGNAAGTIDGSLGTIFQLTPPSTAGGNWTETLLRRFTAGFDGADPAASLLLGPKGVLYGVTNFGGDNQLGGNNYMPGTGTVFQIHP